MQNSTSLECYIAAFEARVRFKEARQSQNKTLKIFKEAVILDESKIEFLKKHFCLYSEILVYFFLEGTGKDFDKRPVALLTQTNPFKPIDLGDGTYLFDDAQFTYFHAILDEVEKISGDVCAYLKPDDFNDSLMSIPSGGEDGARVLH